MMFLMGMMCGFALRFMYDHKDYIMMKFKEFRDQ